MAQIATTIEQSKRLLELGLNPKTADMSYSEEYFGRDENGNDDWYWKLNACRFIDVEGIIPAWSLTALLEVMPKELVNDGYNKKGEQVVALAKLVIDTFVVDGRYMWRIAYKGKRRYWIKIYADNLIRAAFEMDCFLLRQCYIAKGGAS